MRKGKRYAVLVVIRNHTAALHFQDGRKIICPSPLYGVDTDCGHIKERKGKIT